MKKPMLLVLLALLAVLPVRAEYFRHVGLSEGLTQPSVLAIYPYSELKTVLNFQ